jgi:hypothetical protein
MLVCTNAAGEALFPLIVTTDRSTFGVFRNGIEENVDLKVHVGQSACVDAILFYGDLHNAEGVPPAHELLGTHCVIRNSSNIKSFFTPRTLNRLHYIGTVSPSSCERGFPRSLFQCPPKCHWPREEGILGLRVDILTGTA